MKFRRILYVHEIPLLDGSGNALYNIIKELNKKFNIIVLLSQEGPLCDRFDEIGIEYIISDYTMLVYPRINSLRDLLVFIPRIIKIYYRNTKGYYRILNKIKQFNPDIIHTNIGVITIGYKLSKELKIPHVWHIREYQDKDFSWTPIPSRARYILRLKQKNNFCIAISEDIFRYFKMGENAKVIYDGIFDNTKANPINIRKKPYFLFVGRLELGKGVKELINAFVEFNKFNSNMKLYIAGTGEQTYVSKLIHFVEKEYLTEKIDFLGFRNDIYHLMSEAYALIVPSLSEGFGFITAEAMFNGCLVIGNNTAGTKEQFDNGFRRHGCEIGIRYNGHKELVEALRTVTEYGIEYYLPMIEKAYETVLNMYSIQYNSECLLKLYNKISIH